MLLVVFFLGNPSARLDVDTGKVDLREDLAHLLALEGLDGGDGEGGSSEEM